jgi:hypothetical protein
MEYKYYDKPWLPAIKGLFLVLFGLIAMSRISSGIVIKKSKYRWWSLAAGVINLIFCLILAIKIESTREVIGWIILFWIVFQAVTEIVEAGILNSMKNSFAALFLINALLSLLFAYFMQTVSLNSEPQSIFYLGIIVLVSDFMNLEGPKADAFWKLYDEYETQRKALGQKRIALLDQ